MGHTTAYLVAYDEPNESTKMITIVLRQVNDRTLKVRMSRQEAHALINALNEAVTNHYGYISVATN